MHAETQRIWLSWTSASTASTVYDHGANRLLLTADSYVSQAVTASNSLYWTNWIAHQEETAEQRVARNVANEQWQARQRDMAAVRKAASERAERLLVACLSSAQRGELTTAGWFEVQSSRGRRYRIRRGRVRNVIEVDMLGRTLRTYCCHPFDGVPDADTMLAQKLMLETQEDEFLRLANVS
jgi:hypothetical protein